MRCCCFGKQPFSWQYCLFSWQYIEESMLYILSCNKCFTLIICSMKLSNINYVSVAGCVCVRILCVCSNEHIFTQFSTSFLFLSHLLVKVNAACRKKSKWIFNWTAPFKIQYVKPQFAGKIIATTWWKKQTSRTEGKHTYDLIKIAQTKT